MSQHDAHSTRRLFGEPTATLERFSDRRRGNLARRAWPSASAACPGLKPGTSERRQSTETRFRREVRSLALN